MKQSILATTAASAFCLSKRRRRSLHFFFFKDTATTEIYTLSLHDALPIWQYFASLAFPAQEHVGRTLEVLASARSEEHTSELQSRPHLVCRLLLEKKN